MNGLERHIDYSPKIANIDAVLQEDPVGRGIEYLRRELLTDLEGAAKSIFDADYAYIVTGFFIPTAQTIETDGLSGAIFLTRALIQLKKMVFILNDPHNKKILDKGLMTVDVSPITMLPDFDSPPKTWLNPRGKSVLIAVERPGKGVGNKYRTMRGIEIPAYPLDEAFVETKSNRELFSTISCADGLNEVGMGKLRRGIIPKDEVIQSIVSVDYLVVAGIADWAAYGVITALSSMVGEDLLPTGEEQEKLLEAIVRAGAVDGITGKSELTVDTLPLIQHQRRVETLRLLLL